MADAEQSVEQAAMPGGSAAAAILLMLLGDDEAAEVLGHLDPAEIEQLGSAMFDVADVSEGQVESVLDQFMDRARTRTTIGFGTAPRIRAVMQHALGVDRADTVLARITPPTSSRALDTLRWMDAKSIAAVIENEHPQIMALVLAHLEAQIAADVLQLLPQDAQPDIVYRIAKLDAVTAEALDELERVLVRELARISSSPASTRGGTSEAAKIMNSTKPGNDQRIIRTLGKIDKIVAQKIEDEMFIFDDLKKLDAKNMGVVLRNVENDILVVALKGADEKLRETMLGCMSARAADSIRDEMDERGPMRLADVLEAQKAMLSVVRRLSEEGTIMLAGRGDDYV